MESLSLSRVPFWPGITSNDAGARATSFDPTPRKPPTLTTKASILPVLSKRMSLTAPIFALSEPTTSVPLNLVASHCSGSCDATKSALPPLPFVAAGTFELELDGEPGDCAKAPDTISAPIAAPIISFLVMDRLLVPAMGPHRLSFGRTRGLLVVQLAAENSCSREFVADEGREYCVA